MTLIKVSEIYLKRYCFMSDFLTLFDFLFTFAVVLFLVTLVVCLPKANLCVCKNPAKNNMLCFCKSPPYNHKWYWNIKKYTYNCLITNNAFLEICKTIKNKNIYIYMLTIRYLPYLIWHMEHNLSSSCFGFQRWMVSFLQERIRICLI